MSLRKNVNLYYEEAIARREQGYMPGPELSAGGTVGRGQRPTQTNDKHCTAVTSWDGDKSHAGVSVRQGGWPPYSG